MFRKGWAASLYVQRMYREATFLSVGRTILYFQKGHTHRERRYRRGRHDMLGYIRTRHPPHD